MDFDFDLELRYALFAHIARLAANAGVVSATELNAGMPFHGERIPIWNQQKGISFGLAERFDLFRAA